MNALRGYFQRVRISRFTFGAVYAEECSRTVTNKNIRLITMGGGGNLITLYYITGIYSTRFSPIYEFIEKVMRKKKKLKY